MLEYPIVHQGKQVGSGRLQDDGLYWIVYGDCGLLSDRVERLYAGEARLGVLEREGDRLTCKRRLSKSSTPELPPKAGVFTLEPKKPLTPWKGRILDWELEGFREGDTLLFPYGADQPCPCEGLICFFSVRDGYWQLPLQPGWES